MSLASSILAGARQALTLGGSVGTLNKVTRGAFNPTTGEATETLTTHAVQISNPAPIERWEGGRLISTGRDAMILGTHGLTVIPLPGDTLTVGTTTYRIVEITTQHAQNLTMFFRCVVEK